MSFIEQFEFPFHTELQLGLSENREYDQQRGIFSPAEAIFPQEYFVYYKENGAQQAEKTRCLGVLTVFR